MVSFEINTHGTKANVIGMYSLYGNWLYSNWDKKSDVIVAKTDLGIYIKLTLTLTCEEFRSNHCNDDCYDDCNDEYDKHIAELEITLSEDENETIEKITHWTKGKCEIDMISISQFLCPDYDKKLSKQYGYKVDQNGLTVSDDYSCDVFEIYIKHDDYDPDDRYYINKNLFILKYDIIDEKEKFIKTISEELISKVYSPERFSYWIHLDSDNINVFRFFQLFQIIPKFNL